MNRRVLYVQGAGADAGGLAPLEDEFDLRVARGSENALALGRRHGPFAVVVSEEDVADMSGRELLARFRDLWPDTLRILVGRSASLDAALAAMRECGMHSLVPPTGGVEQLAEAVRQGVEQAHQRAFDELTMQQLRFTREVLMDLTAELEGRLDARMGCLQALSELASRVGAAESLLQVARITAEVASSAFGGAGVEVAICDSLDSDRTVEARVGLEVGRDAHEVLLVCGEQVLGVLRLDRSGAPRGLGSSERLLLDAVASTSAAAAAHQVRRRERDEAQEATILALARLAEHRDNETGRHLERVSQYCRLTALALRADGKYTDEITPSFVDDIERSAPLHDIGKVGIADAILLKPGKLDADEWATMKTHTEIGAATLRPLVEKGSAQSYLGMGLDIAWCHHEKWDGSGYPRGLSGQRIPLAARILALADCYDALTTRRPYKEPWPHEEAYRYILGQSGTHFDPDVVAAFEHRIERFDDIRRRLSDDAGEPEPDPIGDLTAGRG